jgi:DNA-binding MarR family transcriptional regulator
MPARTPVAAADDRAKAVALSHDGCSNHRVRRLARQLNQHFDQTVTDAGLKTTQYSLLSHIVRLGPVRPVELARAMGLDASTLTRNLQPLVAAGWVETGPGADDRSRLVSPTEAGRRKRSEAQRAWKRAQQALNERLGVELVAQLHAVVDTCLCKLGDPADDDAP